MRPAVVRLAGLNSHDEAEASFRELIRRGEFVADSYFEIGMICLKRNDTKGAEAAFRKAIDIDKSHAGAYEQLGALGIVQNNIPV